MSEGISVKKNLIYNVIYQLIVLFIPLITVPYISRVLGPTGVGISSYTNSIVQYFIILGTMGISLYGNRQIAYVRDDKEKLSNTFWSINILKFTTSIIALIVYLGLIYNTKDYRVVFLAQSINILSVTADISWAYMGLENFKKIVTTNIAVRIVGLVLILTLVKDINDVVIYVLINAGTAFLGSLSMWPHMRKMLCKTKVKIADIKAHIRPTIALFIPQIAIQVYVVLDRSMLGYLSNTYQVGLYQQSQSITKLVLGLVTSLGVVMLPRMSNMFANGDGEKLKEQLNSILIGVAYVSVPMAFGLGSISEQFVPWFFGKEFNEVKYLLMISVPIIVFIALSNVLGVQYLLPQNRNKEFTLSVVGGAIVNFGLNLVLIPRYHAFGTCVATVLAEFTVTFIQYLFVYKDIENYKIFKVMFKYLLAGILMALGVIFLGRLLGATIITTAIQVIIGVIIYVVILAILKDGINSMVLKFGFTKIKDLLSYKKK